MSMWGKRVDNWFDAKVGRPPKAEYPQRPLTVRLRVDLVFGLLVVGVLAAAAYTPKGSPLYPVLGVAAVVLVMTIAWSILFVGRRRR